ncbi:winged helix-turn-helix domain-containing protein [Streptomyces sp. N2-109]|uniref:Winged helix-turn-helix domain-containing protein n=1 Tax=Streptomyces gossypii TaxID=2883101 RepID=A0ABT2JN77_9ACTN|nr:winged helix-turn-helix domain-containing protein [Streptomyces gossypii]MCT2589196.1 winged helix-turn-helix domain-containing protein [Streptomyces gossypii]
MTRAENDPRAPFEQLADDLREQIRSAAIGPGQKLPSVRELSERSGFVSATVQKSLGVLRNEGWIFTTGRGSFVPDPDAPTGPTTTPVTAEDFAELKAQFVELAERVQSLEKHLADGTDS